MYIFNYNPYLAKQLKCEYSYGKMILLVTLAVLLATALMMGSLFLLDGFSIIPFILMLIPIIAVICYCSNEKVLYGNAPRIVFVYENNKLYKMTFFGDILPAFGGAASVVSIAYNIHNEKNCQNEAANNQLVYQTLQQHKQGYSTFSKFTGQGTQVVEMNNIQILKEKAKYWQCSFVDERGKLRKTKILKTYNNFFLPNFVRLSF